ncbi:MAG: phosphatase PAP2 family protein [Gemmatimonadaceae bacterium]
MTQTAVGRIASWRGRGAMLVSALVAIAAVPPRSPAAQEKDTTNKQIEPLFTSRDLVYGGIFVVGSVALLPLDKQIAKEIQRPSNQTNRFLRRVATDFRLSSQPGALIIGGGLYAVGRLGEAVSPKNEILRRMADLGLHGTEAIVLATAADEILKGVLGRARPYVAGDTDAYNFAFGRGFRKGTPYQSFPSGHTVTGFAAAAAVTEETSRWWPKSTWIIGPIMYGGATMIGLSRMYNNAHWTSDVVMGAGLGALSGIKVVRYNHAHSNNRLDRILLNTAIVPTGDGGIAVAIAIPSP